MQEDDIVAVTTDISYEDVIRAYQLGIFPWPLSEEEQLIPWCSPHARGVLDFAQLHVSRSTLKTFRKQNFTVSFSQHFEEVLHHCASVKRKNQPGTWITSPLKKAYIDLFNHEKAYSVEVYKDSKLVGGLYGVISDKYISGESMFHLETGASKFALIKLIEQLKKLDVFWIDTQMTTPLLSDFGGKEIQKKDFLSRLTKGKMLESNFFERLKSYVK